MENKRILKDKIAQGTMGVLTLVSALLVAVLAVGLYLKSLPILETASLYELLSSDDWLPSQGKFGLLPFVAGSTTITFLAIAFALPISLLSSVYLTEFAHSKIKQYVFPVLDILAGLPSVIYGVWGTLIVVPLISKTVAPFFGVETSGYTALAGGVVLGIMVLPLLISLFVEIFGTVSADLRIASIALGATRWQTSWHVVLRKTFPGIVASVVLAITRALGETIAVLMVCGCVVKMPNSLFEGVYPIPALIANNYGEMLSIPLYESALMLGALMLFAVVFFFNLIARITLRHLENKNS